MCWCDICEKEMISKTNSKHFNFNTHLHRKDNGIVVIKHEITKSKIDEVDEILRDVIEDSREKFFHTFECIFIDDTEFTKMENYELIKLTITHGYNCFKLESDGLNKKIKSAQKMDLDLLK